MTHPAPASRIQSAPVKTIVARAEDRSQQARALVGQVSGPRKDIVPEAFREFLSASALVAVAVAVAVFRERPKGRIQPATVVPLRKTSFYGGRARRCHARVTPAT